MKNLAHTHYSRGRDNECYNFFLAQWAGSGYMCSEERKLETQAQVFKERGPFNCCCFFRHKVALAVPRVRAILRGWSGERSSEGPQQHSRCGKQTHPSVVVPQHSRPGFRVLQLSHGTTQKNFLCWWGNPISLWFKVEATNLTLPLSFDYSFLFPPASLRYN